VAELLQVGCSYCHPTNSIKTLKYDGVPDWGQHAASMLSWWAGSTVVAAASMLSWWAGNTVVTVLLYRPDVVPVA